MKDYCQSCGSKFNGRGVLVTLKSIEWDDRRIAPRRHGTLTRNICLNCWQALTQFIQSRDMLNQDRE